MTITKHEEVGRKVVQSGHIDKWFDYEIEKIVLDNGEVRYDVLYDGDYEATFNTLKEARAAVREEKEYHKEHLR